MAKGTVKWFSAQKGYGFIEVTGEDKEIFAHHTDIQGTGFKSLQEGEEVEFDIKSTPKGEQAANIVKIG